MVCASTMICVAHTSIIRYGRGYNAANAVGDALSNFTRRGLGNQDVEIERKVSLAARNLCYGVQRIVMAAKGKSGVEWKAELLALLGGADDQIAMDHCDMDILLVAPKTEKFVSRCLENELPPNMIHCLRLLRVLELQHATQKHKENSKLKKPRRIKPISSRATKKVSLLLRTLCSDPTVGEQLRPHLFGLLALSGASYPASGVHVAKAASQVIIAFAENCLSQSLVWFLHDRKMIIHMTDDIKELCGKSSGTSQSGANTLSLYGADAEEHGLWAISLSTVVHLVVYSCRLNCRELLKDFEAATGNDVLKGAIIESKSKYGKKLMELLPLLATCRVTEEQDESDEITSMADPNHYKLAVNPAAFEIIEDLMLRSIPLLREYVDLHGKQPEISDEKSIRDLAEFSLNIAVKLRFTGDNTESSSVSTSREHFDVATDLLLACLTLYSEHKMNYDLVENRNHILAIYILAFPTFQDENLKVLILKTIEFVAAGVTGSKAAQPSVVLGEIFVAICKALLNSSIDDPLSADQKALMMDGFFADTELINESLKKMFQFENRLGPSLMRSINQIVDTLSALLLNEMQEKGDTWEGELEISGETTLEPAVETPLCRGCAAMFRVVALTMAEKSKRGESLLSFRPEKKAQKDLIYLLLKAVRELGDEAATAASGVFYSIMASRENLELLRGDMDFCLRLIDKFATVVGESCGVPVVAEKFMSKKVLKLSAMQEIHFDPIRPLSVVYLRRVTGLYAMIKSVLETSNLARDAFRLSSGFESMIKMVLCLGGSAALEEKDPDISTVLLDLFEIILSVVDAAIGFNSREEPDMHDIETDQKNLVALPADTLVDPISTQHAAPKAAVQNLYYLRQKSFYLDFAVAIAQTKIMMDSDDAIQVMELAMSHMDPLFSLSRDELEKEFKVKLLRHPDAARLVLGLVLFLPNTEDGVTLSKLAFDQIIRLCDPSKLGTTLSQIANCGMIWSLTNPKEFAPILDNKSHPLYSRFTLLLRRIAAFSMSYSDFVSIIRRIAGPLLNDEKADSRIRLPVITSSVRRRLTSEADDLNTGEEEADFCRRLESLCTVAERGERVPYCTLGGGTINTLSVLLHETKLEDRLYKAAEDGRLTFLEVDCIDTSSLKPGGFLSAGVPAPGSSGGERVWTPMATSGFSLSVWFRYPKPQDESREGNIFLLDMSNPLTSTSDGLHTPESAVFFSIWYDLQQQRFNVLTSSSYRGDPICFPVSPLVPGVWHHVLLTYTPSKRTMMGRKAALMLCVDGRPLEADVKIECVNIAPNAKVVLGAPSPIVATGGSVRGMIPIWDLGPTIMLSTVLMELDATAIFVHGPDFQGLFWGDRPQRHSLSATGSAAFALFAETGEPGSVASALRRREIAKLEAAGTVSREMGLGGSSDEDNDSLALLGLLCTIPSDSVVFAYRAATRIYRNASETEQLSSKKKNWSEQLMNLARINSSNEFVSTSASVYGKAGVVTPRCFADNVQWIGGPQIMMPLTFATTSSKSLALALRLIRSSTNRHPPNLEAMQGGGGFQMLAFLIQGKKFVDEKVVDQAFAFAVHGFSPSAASGNMSTPGVAVPSSVSQASNYWVFSDLDAMKQLLLNHQVWDLKNSGPDLPLRLVSFMNGLVAQKSVHKAFNSRRLHLVGIVRWTLHLMVEAAELYTLGEMARQNPRKRTNSEELDLGDPTKGNSNAAFNSGWYSEAPNADAVAVGGDPDNPLLQACKTLLRRVLTFMLTPGDLDEIAQITMHTINIGSSSSMGSDADRQKFARSQSANSDSMSEPEKLLPGPVARVYLLRLIEELIVDGVNEIVAIADRRTDGDHMPVQTHAGGIANPSQSYLSLAILGGKIEEGQYHPKHSQAQNFLSAFANVFTPVWFAALLEGCQEEATASAVLRLMILMNQSSPVFASAFETQGGFAPLVLSIPKFSTCSSVIISLLSQLLHVSILHLPCFPMLDAYQLNEVFQSENELSEVISKAYSRASADQTSEPACGIFALLAECIDRNIQLAPSKNVLGQQAKQTNDAILELLLHRHNLSPSFQAFCRTLDFIEPLAQALSFLYDSQRKKNREERDQDISDSQQPRKSRRGSLREVPDEVSPTERYTGKQEDEPGSGSMMVRLLRMVVSSAVVAGPVAPPLIHSLFCSFTIHASVEQVEAYQLLLIDICRSTLEDAIDLGEAAALASCVGICSALLDRLMQGFFSSKAMLQTVNMTLVLLNNLTSSASAASRNIGNLELSMITADAAHIARLACVSTLRRSRPLTSDDPGDPDLQEAVVEITAKNIHTLMIVPKMSMTGRRTNSSLHPAPPNNSRMHPLWTAASVSRCSTNDTEYFFPDLSEAEEPLRIFVVSLTVEVSFLLKDPRENMRLAAVKIVVALLQQRRGIMSGLLIKELQSGDRIETIDVMNRGGFGALLVAHEVAMSTVGSTTSKKNYAAFFEWFERHQEMVQIVFDDIEAESKRIFPNLDLGAPTVSEAVEIHQHNSYLNMASSESADRTIIGGIERSGLIRQCAKKTILHHTQWKRQGFDDLASGAMQWKFLLRRLKGSCSIWEGGPRYEERSLVTRLQQLYGGLSSENDKVVFALNESGDADKIQEMVKRWKLDLTEGSERQRRRLLPNYEFHSLYNVDENDDWLGETNRSDDDDVVTKFDSPRRNTRFRGAHHSLNPAGDIKGGQESQPDFFVGDGLIATAELLKELKIKKVNKKDLDDEDLDDEDLDDEDLDDDDDEDLDGENLDDEDMQTETTATGSSVYEGESISKLDNKDLHKEETAPSTTGADEDGERESRENHEAENASSYELITGLLQAGDWPEESYNVRRCTGLEVRKALLLWCRDAIYVIDGFEQTEGDGLDGMITRVEKEESSYNVNLRPKDFKVSDDETDSLAESVVSESGKSEDKSKNTKKSAQESSNEVTYQHRSQRIAFSDLHSVFRRRYQLQQLALEFYDIHNVGTLIAFANHAEREGILRKVLATPLPNSIFNSGFGVGASINYKKFMNSWKSKIVSQWVNGKMTNFEFLMHLNSFAGRTYNDLTQYPVFPWIIADYESEEIDLNDPKTYRDLSKSMGALGEERAQQFRERYEALEANYFNEDEPPPFHYGTHYSCAAYVLYYLMRLEPFSRLALTLQGGRFDVADRLFHNIGNSWTSASQDNLQDVRELIPEFFYLPDFLTNTNNFDFGTTQKGKTVHNVTLPKWAKGDPNRFIRINRQALESEYVSKNLHQWVDLIFGYKQRGEEAVKALNTFVHVTYEGEVDFDSMTDPVERESTIAQIQNFGQTPSRLERRPFQQKHVVSSLKEKSVDFGSLFYLAPLTPPFCIVGAGQRCQVKRISSEKCRLGITVQTDNAVGDMHLLRGQIIGVGRMCTLNIADKIYYRYGSPNNGLSMHVAYPTSRNRELNKMLSIHDGLHRAEISVAKASLNGQWLVTGCIDSTVRVWKYDSPAVRLRATLCGHEGSKITCIDISNAFGIIATGCAQGRVVLWDLRTLTFVRRLRHEFKDENETPAGLERATTSVSINQKNGNIVTLVGPHLSVFDVNGKLISTENSLGARPTCSVSTDCPEWQERGIVAVTGHVNGEVRFWSLDYDKRELSVRHLMVDREHTCEITALRVTGTDRQDTLLVGDKSGKMSLCKTVQLESMSNKEITEVVAELRSELHLTTDADNSDEQDLVSKIRSTFPGQYVGSESLLEFL